MYLFNIFPIALFIPPMFISSMYSQFYPKASLFCETYAQTNIYSEQRMNKLASVLQAPITLLFPERTKRHHHYSLAWHKKDSSLVSDFLQHQHGASPHFSFVIITNQFQMYEETTMILDNKLIRSIPTPHTPIVSSWQKNK